MVFLSNSLKNNQIVHIDTAQTSNITFIGGNKSSIRISLKNGGINIPKNSSSRLLMSLYSATIPTSWYNIRSGDNNSFILKEGSVEITITIPEGNYNAKILASIIQQLMTSASFYGNTYTMIYNSIKNKFYFTTTDIVNTCYIKFVGDDNAYIQMGFNPNTENIIGNVVPTYSTNSISMYDKFSVYIRSSLIQGGSTYLNEGTTNIIERIGVKAFNSIATYEANPIQNKFIIGDNIDSIDLQITFEDESNLVNLNGLNWQVSLLFSVSTDLKSVIPDRATKEAFLYKDPFSEPSEETEDMKAIQPLLDTYNSSINEPVNTGQIEPKLIKPLLE